MSRKPRNLFSRFRSCRGRVTMPAVSWAARKCGSFQRMPEGSMPATGIGRTSPGRKGLRARRSSFSTDGCGVAGRSRLRRAHGGWSPARSRRLDARRGHFRDRRQRRAPVSLLTAANWDLTGTVRVFSRDDATGTWTAASLAHGRPVPDFLPLVRSFGGHRDSVTGIDRVFAGENPHGIFGGTYDPAVAGHIRWSASPELNLSGVSEAGLSGRSGHLRVSSFAECNGRLYAAVGQQIYERIDGAEPHWAPRLHQRVSRPFRDRAARTDDRPEPLRPWRGAARRRRRQRCADRAR